MESSGRILLVVAFAWNICGPGEGQAQSHAEARTSLFPNVYSIPIGANPCGLALGDIDGDGHADLVTVMGMTPRISISRGDGHGNFLPATYFALPAARSPRVVRIADVDGDGRADLLIAGGGVFVAYGTQSGVLNSPVQILPTSGYADVATAVRDGHATVAAVSTKGYIDILAGWTQQGFGSRLRLHTDMGSERVVIVDMDSDGLLDVVTGSPHTSRVMWQKQLPTGGFDDMSYVASGNGVAALAIVDVDRDGHPDIVAANEYSDSLAIFSGLGGTPLGSRRMLYGGDSPLDVLQFDPNGDGLPDLLSVNSGIHSSIVGTRIAVLLGRGAAAFSAPLEFVVGVRPVAAATADLDGDSKDDIVIANLQSGDVTVLLTRLDEHSGRMTNVPACNGPTGLCTGDWDQDGLLDIASAGIGDGQIVLFRNIGNGEVERWRSLAMGRSARALVQMGSRGRGVKSLAALVGDGAELLRVVIVTPSEHDRIDTLMDVPATPLMLASGIADTRSGEWGLVIGSAGPIDSTCDCPRGLISVIRRSTRTRKAWVRADVVMPQLPAAIQYADVSGDGIADLVMAMSNGDANPGQVYIWRGRRNGGFAGPSRHPVGLEPRSIAIADLDGDRLPEIVVANEGSRSEGTFVLGSVSMLWNLGGGRFGPSEFHDTRNAPVSVAIGDVDGNATRDVVVANFYSNTVSVLFGDGTRKNWRRRDVQVGAFPVTVAAVQLSNSSVRSVVVVNRDDLRMGSIDVVRMSHMALRRDARPVSRMYVGHREPE